MGIEKAFFVRNGLMVGNSNLYANNGMVGINTSSVAVTLQIASNDALFLPRGNTAQRPTANNGLIRFNTETGQFEGYSNNAWGYLTNNLANTTQFLANTPGMGIDAQQYWNAGAYATLTDAATIAVNLALGINFTVSLTSSRILGFPTNPKVGQSGLIEIVQPAGGGCTLSFASGYKFDSGTAPSINIAANAKTGLGYHVRSGALVWISMPYYGVQ
jgi:hypothetical protein